MKNYCILLFLICFVRLVSAQDIEYFDEFKNSLNKDLKENISDAEKDIKSADGFYKQAESILSSKDISAGLKLLKKSSDIFVTAFRAVYTSFGENLANLSENTEGQKKDYADYMIYDAGNYFRKSIADRMYADKEKIESDAVDLYISAHTNEVKAVYTQCHLFAVLTGMLQDDLTIPNTEYSETEVFDNSVTDNFHNHDFTVKNVDMPEIYNYHQTEIVYVDPDENGNHSNTQVYDPNTNVDVKGTEYRIQIGTSIIPANEIQINRLNNTDLPVKTFKSVLYYKYTIGGFKSFHEAKNFKNAYGLNNTYIVKYLDGKEVKLYLKDIQ